jgi:hypothetical protein
VDADVVLTVVYTGQPDEVFEFSEEGQGRLFGRDDTQCEIVVWSAINGTELSRVAGRIWRMDDELWLRNLSTRHELRLSQPGLPEEPPLPPRREEGADPGPARSIPGGIVLVHGPAGCELLIRQRRRGAIADTFREVGEATTRVPPVPERLRPVAAALCEPLLRGGQLPATYSEVMQRAGTGTLKRTRTAVAELTGIYLAEIPLLRERIADRIQREEAELELTSAPQLRGGVWTFPQPDETPEQAQEQAWRRRALALPDYYEIAHLLVRRRIVTAEDLEVLARAAGPA